MKHQHMYQHVVQHRARIRKNVKHDLQYRCPYRDKGTILYTSILIEAFKAYIY